MSKSIKVSVIVPVYNVEQYLAKCLDSLVNQTLEEIEILVVNDGSPDNSQAIIDDYAARYPNKIRSFIKENGGLSDARNYGIQQARGEYLGFVDSDDFVDLDMYEHMYNKAVRTESEVVACPITYEYMNKATKKTFPEELFGSNIKEHPTILRYANSPAPNKIFRKDFWQKHGFRFPVGQWFEDSALIYNIMIVANKVSCVNIPFMHYVKDRGDSITNSFDMRIFDIFKSANSIITFAKEHNCFDSLNEELEYLCLRHILARVPLMRKCPDRTVTKQWINKFYALMDVNFPKWRKSSYVKDSNEYSISKRIKLCICRSKYFMTLYLIRSAFTNIAAKLYRYIHKKYTTHKKRIKNLLTHPIYTIKNQFFKLFKKEVWAENVQAKKQDATNQENIKKRHYLQKNGMDVLQEVQTILKDLGIDSFADFGTCLGFIREGKMLAHDLDMDIGVIATPNNRAKIRIALERRGFKLWRQYIYHGNPVEESYHYKDVKVDLNFYEMTDTYARTWLFYRKPNHTYENTWSRHVVQMTYSPIRGVKCMEIDGRQIMIPENPELLLEEKYGPNWRIPDTGWIYWESPAAVKLDDIGTFKTYKYLNT